MTDIKNIPELSTHSPSNQAAKKDSIFTNSADDEKVDIVSKRIIKQNNEAYLKLAK